MPVVCLVNALSLTIAMRGCAAANAPDPTIRDAVEPLKTFYATETTLEKPLEIKGFKIIPLTMVGIGYGQRPGDPDRQDLQGAGGVLSPVGFLIASHKGVQLLPVSKGLLEQLLGAVTVWETLLSACKGLLDWSYRPHLVGISTWPNPNTLRLIAQGLGLGQAGTVNARVGKRLRDLATTLFQLGTDEEEPAKAKES